MQDNANKEEKAINEVSNDKVNDQSKTANQENSTKNEQNLEDKSKTTKEDEIAKDDKIIEEKNTSITKEQILKTPDLKNPPASEIKIILKEETETNENICNILIEAIKSYTDNKYSSKFPKYIRSKMEAEFGKGWNVFVGEHFCGVCLFEDDTLVQVKIGSLIVLIFKTFLYED